MPGSSIRYFTDIVTLRDRRPSQLLLALHRSSPVPWQFAEMSESSRAEVPATGLTVVFDPGESVSTTIDIVFLHGFTGHPVRTWSDKVTAPTVGNTANDCSAEPPSKLLKQHLFSSSRHGRANPTTTVFWPRDLLPITVPCARVLTYGYDTHLRHVFGPPVNKATVYDIAWDFLVALEAERQEAPLRPVLFVAHSLGGIVVKEMLRRASSLSHRPHLCNIFRSTAGIVFFGTPHGGADPRGFLQRAAETLIKVAGIRANEQIVNALLPSSERLRELRDEFGPIAQTQGWLIHSFQEGLSVKLLNGEKVVEDASSCLHLPPIEITQHIGKDHMEMCRFPGLDDVEYRKVAATLRRVMKVVAEMPKTARIPSLSDSQRAALLASLKFDQIDARQMSIRTAHSQTCKWLLKRPEYLDWLNAIKTPQHHGLLWIRGKPGTGKSTLMKFALTSSRRTMKDRTVLSFFFNARGSHLEKSTSGMYRSLLLQLLERLPRLQTIFESLGFASWNTHIQHTWSIETLKDGFEQAVHHLGETPTICFIDALDECDEDEIRDMVKFFQRLGEFAVASGVQFHVLFASRHYPHITIDRCLSLFLEGQEGHDKDIIAYVDSELKIGHGGVHEEIRRELQEKSNGVFMWVVLVVDILNKECDRGRTGRRLQQKLREVPGDLHKLFLELLTRDGNNRDGLLLSIQWVLFARRPLKPEELYFAVISGIEPEEVSEWNSDQLPIEAIQRFILNSTKGLAETTKSKIPTVQFIHESVRDFLLKENGLKEVWPDLGDNFYGASHSKLAQCSLSYIKSEAVVKLDMDPPKDVPSPEATATLRQSVGAAFPFLAYAAQNVLSHAEAAESSGVSQRDFIRSFPITHLVQPHNLFEKFKARQHTPNVSLLYLLAEYNLSALIRALSSGQSCFEQEGERYGPPIFAGMAMQSFEAVRAMLEVQAATQPPISELLTLAECCERIDKDGYFKRDFRFSAGRGVISHAAEFGNEAFISACLVALDEDVNRASQKRTPLGYAALRGNEVAIRLLIEIYADTEARGNDGKTPLSLAAMNGHEKSIQLLLERGADIEARDKDGWTPLIWAAMNGHEKSIRLLLERGADIEAKDEGGRTPLIWATRNGHEKSTQLLLERGADIKAKDKNGQTPLIRAAMNGHEKSIQLLLERGADIQAKDKNG
ncbi:hypothetical protein B0T25DRAFT_485826, partial [Lasiosphaeria hispida]